MVKKREKKNPEFEILFDRCQMPQKTLDCPLVEDTCMLKEDLPRLCMALSHLVRPSSTFGFRIYSSFQTGR